nr:MAG TPA: hypothetical protein [Caudoviricetes sp.]
MNRAKLVLAKKALEGESTNGRLLPLSFSNVGWVIYYRAA